MKNKIKLTIIMMIISIMLSTSVLAITEVDNGIMKIYLTSGGLEFDDLEGFDIQGYITTDEATNEKTLISSTFGDDGYHTFLNVNGKNGEMTGKLTYEDDEELDARLKAMQYTAYDSNNEWQTIDGINMKVNTQFINNGEQLQIVYTLKNTTSESATISLATTSDVQIDEDDSATIERLEDGSGVRLWTKEGYTDKPVQFVFYGKDVNGATNVDNLWIGRWSGGDYLEHIFDNNPDEDKIENYDSAFTYSWVNRTIAAGETQTYSVLMEVGEINIPNTGITLENNTKFYYSDVIINGTVIDKDLKDNITIHYVVDGTEYVLPKMSTTGVDKDFALDLTSLGLSAGEEHTLKVWATDSTDCESNVVERIFTVTYLKNPELSVSNEEWTKDDVTFKITDTQNVEQYVDKYQYRINNGSWVECDKDKDISVQENGNIQIDVRIVGTENNDYSDVITKYAKIDHVNPNKTMPTATKTTSSITVDSTQTDEHSGIDTTKTLYAIKKENTWSDWQESNTFTGLKDNTEYIVKTKSTDMVGNTSESEELSIKTDELLLGNLILKLNSNEGQAYTENSWTNQNIYVAIQERSIGATTSYYSKENSAQTITQTNQETTVTQNGTTTLLLSVTDGTNTVTSDIEHILKVDNIAPVINELSLDNEEWSTNNKNLTAKAIDELSGIEGYQFSKQENITTASSGWNSVTPSTEEITQNIEINEGGKYYFYVKDVAGNISVVNIDTKIDALGPVINFERANGATIINVTDTGSGVNVIQYAWTSENTQPSQTDWKNYSEAVKYEEENSGKIYLWAKAIDNIGNETTSSTTFTAIKEPEINSKDNFVNEYISFKLNSDNEDSDVIYQFKMGEGDWQEITKNSEYTITNITNGTVIIQARSIDNAGRYSNVISKEITVSIQNSDDIENEDPNGQNNNNGNANQDLNGSTTNDSTGKINSQDKTIAGGKIPQTGISNKILILITAVLGVAIFMYIKIRLYKDIK